VSPVAIFIWETLSGRKTDGPTHRAKSGQERAVNRIATLNGHPGLSQAMRNDDLYVVLV
jgi:hypothetical protein